MINFAEGASGVIHLLTAAAELFPNMAKDLVERSIKIGDLIWMEGLVFQGNSLFDGISGNGYALHCLFRCLATQSKKSNLIT